MDDYNDDSYYLQLKKKAAKKAKKKEWKERQTVYARMFTDKWTSKVALQYWFFYVYNDWGGITKLGNKHEGDWEMIQIILKNNQPEHITYSIHEGGLELSWDSIEKKEDTHPIVYVTKGGHGSWNKAGNHTWYQKAECLQCTDETDNKGDILYPKTIHEISKIESSAKKIEYAIEYMTDWTDENKDWIYWKGYWGKQAWEKNSINLGRYGPSSPPYIDYIDDDEQKGRWYDPISWGYSPNPGGYVICNSGNSKIIAYDEEKNIMQLILHWSVAGICGYCSEIKAIYTNKDLQFEVYSSDGEEVTLKISRYNRDTNEVHEVEFDWLEIPKNGKATLKFSPKKNPDFEIMVDNDLDNATDRIVMPDYSTQYQR